MKHPTQFQRFLALFVKQDGTFCGKMIPLEPWWNASFRKARGTYIKSSGVGFSFGGKTSIKDMIWYLTPYGKEEAKKADEYIREWVKQRSEECRRKAREPGMPE